MKKFTALFLSAILFAACFGVSVSAQSPAAVKTAEQLMNMKPNGSYYLAGDIDLSNVDWIGISGFSGSFDGKGHIINGLTSEGYGLFSTLKSGAVIKNVVLDNVYITSKYSSIGAIAASVPSSAKNVLIENCYVNGVVASCRTKFGLNAGSSTAGSIVGRNDSASSVISGCYSNAVVAAERTVGGIAGINYGTIKSCGFGGQTGSSYNIYELGCNTDGVKRDDYKYLYCVGGICGFNYSRVSNSFSNCTRVDVASYYGGIAGVLQKSGSISYCVNSSEVLYDDNLTGGLIAGYASGKSKLSNCYTKSPTNSTVQSDVGKGGKGKSAYRISAENYDKISSFKTLDGDWQIWDGVPVLKKLKSYILMTAPEYEIKGEKLIPIEYSVDAVDEEEDLSVDYGFDEFGDILE